MHHVKLYPQRFSKEDRKKIYFIFNIPSMAPYKLLWNETFSFSDHVNNWLNVDTKPWPLVLRCTSRVSDVIDCLLSSIIPPTPVGFLRALTFAGSDLTPPPSRNSCQQCFCGPLCQTRRGFIRSNLCCWTVKLQGFILLRLLFWH